MADGERCAVSEGGSTDADASRPPEATPTPTPLPPPQRGWYRVPDNPNYERFWDGQKWGQRRYWGGAADPHSTTGAPGVSEPIRNNRRPSDDAPVHYRGFFDTPFNPRSPIRQVVVAGVGLCLGLAYL